MNSLFDMDQLLTSTAVAAVSEDTHWFQDLRDWYGNNPRPNIPPDPTTYSKEALAQLPGMEWLSGVDAQLIYPQSQDLDWQRSYLENFIRVLKAEAVFLTNGFCPKFPADYNEPLLAIDTETTGLDTRVRYSYDGSLQTRTKLVGTCLATSPNKGYYLPVRHTEEDGVPNWNPDVMAWFLGELNEQFTCIFHNAVYDREVEALNGVQKFRPYPYFFDTQILDFFYDVNNKVHGLKPCSKRHLGRTMVEIQELFYGIGAAKSKNNYITFDTIPATTALVYGAADTMNTYGLFAFYAGQPEASNMFAQQATPLEIDHKLVEVVRHMVRPGMPINFQYYYYAAKDALYRLGRTEQFIYHLIGRKIELNSPKQMSELLFDELKIPAIDETGQPQERGKNGSYSTGEEILDKLYELYPDVIILKYIVLYRKIKSTISKIYFNALVNSYVDAVLPYTKVQLSFSMTTVPTGRLSSSSSDGAERVTLKVTGKSQKKNYTYHHGTWDFGANSQGIPNPSFRRVKAKRLTKLPEGIGIDKDNLYTSWVDDQFLKGLAEV